MAPLEGTHSILTSTQDHPDINVKSDDESQAENEEEASTKQAGGIPHGSEARIGPTGFC